MNYRDYQDGMEHEAARHNLHARVRMTCIGIVLIIGTVISIIYLIVR